MTINELVDKLNTWSDWVRKTLRKRKILAGRGIAVQQMESGVVVSVIGQFGGVSGAGGTGSYPCITTGAYSGGKVPVDVYKNGLDQPKTGTGDLYVMQLHISSDIPIGTKMMGFDTSLVNYNDEE